MNRYDRFKARLNQIIEQGSRVLGSRHRPSPRVTSGDFVDSELFYQWKASSLSFLAMAFGKDSTHYSLYNAQCQSSRHSDAVKGQGVLLAAKEDLEGGFLGRLEGLVSADIFSDFLDMAEHLLSEGYKDPAAALTGAVLEDGLRRIAGANQVDLKTSENIGSLNQKLADSQIYNRITQKRIQVWNDVRNQADHGKFADYDAEHVREMLAGVRGLLAENL
jgi:hypothetical protein